MDLGISGPWTLGIIGIIGTVTYFMVDGRLGSV
jgi:hypothetical protein